MNKLLAVLALIASLLGQANEPNAIPPDDLPICEVTESPGYTTEDELEAQIAEAPPEETCQVDPATVEITDGPVPTGCHVGGGCSPYHHNGWQGPATDRQGGQGNFQVKNASSLPHDGSVNYFAVGRVLLKRPSNGNGAEAGWSEVSWSNNDVQRVYTYSTQDNLWHFYGSYSLSANTYYGFRVTYSNGNARTSIFWSGSWQLLKSYSEPNCHPQSSDVCRVEEMVEVYSNVDNQHPSWGNSVGGQAFQTNSNGTWSSWSSTDGVTASGDVNPYKLCTDVHGHSSTSCLRGVPRADIPASNRDLIRWSAIEWREQASLAPTPWVPDSRPDRPLLLVHALQRCRHRPSIGDDPCPCH